MEEIPLGDDLGVYLAALDDREFETVRRQVTQLGSSSKREGNHHTASFWAAVLHCVQRERLRRLRLGAESGSN
jgi:hypothetical protein